MNYNDFLEEYEEMRERLQFDKKQVILVSNKDIEVWTSGTKENGIAIVQNKTDFELYIDFFDINDSICLAPHGFLYIENSNKGKAQCVQFYLCNFIIY